MSIDSFLKKEGIDVIKKLDTLTVNSIAISIASKLCLALPEHKLNKNELFASFARLDMYVANFSSGIIGAKYFYKNNSVYFSNGLSLQEMSDLGIHECIHFMQELKDDSGNITRMGLYNVKSGLSLNEAAVQLIASEANMQEPTCEKYYNIELKTISPNYYPLECALVNQMAYFTGTYPLYTSTLNSNDVFKNTFCTKTDSKTYHTIEKNLDKLLDLEANLDCYSFELQNADKLKDIKLLNKLIVLTKEKIFNLFFSTQNLIMKKCFQSEFKHIKTLEGLHLFKKRFYDYKDVIGCSDNYTFYNDFYIDMINSFEKKKQYLAEHGEIDVFSPIPKELSLITTSSNSASLIKSFLMKIQKLFRLNSSTPQAKDL